MKDSDIKKGLDKPMMSLWSLVVIALLGTLLQAIDIFLPSLMRVAIYIVTIGGSFIAMYYIYKARELTRQSYKIAFRRKFQYEYLRDSIKRIQDKKDSGSFVTFTLINQMDMNAVDKIDPFCPEESWRRYMSEGLGLTPAVKDMSKSEQEIAKIIQK